MKKTQSRIFLLALAALVSLIVLYINAKKNSNSAYTSNSYQGGILTNSDEKNKITTESGLQYTILKEGFGTESPNSNSVVTVHYVGKLSNGVEFDSSYSRNQPASFPVNGVIPGWTEALQLMREGDKWELTIPPELGYGTQGAGNTIPPNSTLIFEVELLEIE